MLADQTVGMLSTRVVGLARVHTVPVLTSSCDRALGIGFTTDRDATGNRVAFVPADAPAVGDVALRVALGVSAAGVIQQARVDALAVAAGFSVLAFGVRLTSDRFAFDLRIADGSFRALTDGSVVGEEAVCALAAVARVHADPVDTRGIFFAFVIANATC
jgi:hypothetical protein